MPTENNFLTEHELDIAIHRMIVGNAFLEWRIKHAPEALAHEREFMQVQQEHKRKIKAPRKCARCGEVSELRHGGRGYKKYCADCARAIRLEIKRKQNALLLGKTRHLYT